MLTTEKLEIYKKYKGFYDGYYIQHKGSLQHVIVGDDWELIREILQDLYLVRKGLAATSYAEALNKRLAENCENPQTIQALADLEKYIFEQ